LEAAWKVGTNRKLHLEQVHVWSSSAPHDLMMLILTAQKSITSWTVLWPVNFSRALISMRRGLRDLTLHWIDSRRFLRPTPYCVGVPKESLSSAGSLAQSYVVQSQPQYPICGLCASAQSMSLST
jgi:hypothetical protein